MEEIIQAVVSHDKGIEHYIIRLRGVEAARVSRGGKYTISQIDETKMTSPHDLRMVSSLIKCFIMQED